MVTACCCVYACCSGSFLLRLLLILCPQSCGLILFGTGDSGYFFSVSVLASGGEVVAAPSACLLEFVVTLTVTGGDCNGNCLYFCAGYDGHDGSSFCFCSGDCGYFSFLVFTGIN